MRATLIALVLPLCITGCDLEAPAPIDDEAPPPTASRGDELVATLPSAPPAADPALPPPLAAMSTAPVGKTPGRWDVTAAGAAAYTIPLEVPPGRRGLQPAPALTYNSRVKNGPLGVGWSLSGVTSAITPCGRRMGPDDRVSAVKWAANAAGDRLCLDDQRLVLVAGTYHGAGSEYRTEHDSFRKIVQVGAPATHFLVYTREGLILRYGKRDGCTSCNGYVKARVGARAFLLVEVNDRFGNSMFIDYQIRSNTRFEDWDQDGVEDLPSTAQREGVEYFPIVVHYSDGSSPSGRAVTFTWEDRPDPTRGFFAGIRDERTKRLKTVKTWVGSTIVRAYHLAYQVDSSSTGTGKSRLASVTECSGTNDDVCKPATTFEYSSGSATYLSRQVTPFVAPPAGLPASANGDYPATPLPILSMDVDDDGRSDLVYPKGPAGEHAGTDVYDWHILKMGSSGLTNATEHDTAVQAAWPFAAVPIDYNRDGRKDVLLLNDEATWEVLLTNSTGTGFTYTDTGIIKRLSLPMSASQPADLYRLIKVADLNGDGAPDVLTCANAMSGAGHRWSYRLHDGVKFGAEVELPTSATGTGDCQPQAFFAMVFDVDGDGAADLLIPRTTSYWAVRFNGAVSAFDTALPGSVPNECNNTNRLRQIDLNHDGLTDLVGGQTSSTSAIRLRYWLNMGGRFAGGSAGYAALSQDFGQYGESLVTSLLIEHDGDGFDDLLVNGDTTPTTGCGGTAVPCPPARSGNWEVLVNNGIDSWTPGVKFTTLNTGIPYSPRCPGGNYCEGDLCVPVASRDCGSGYARGRAIDENGDLLPDLVFVANDDDGYGDDVFMFSRHAAGVPDLLLKVRDGMVGVTPTSSRWASTYSVRFVYSPSTSSAVYQPAVPGETRTGCAWPISCVRQPMMLVSTAYEDRGDGNAPASTSYDYYDARTHDPGGASLGFLQRRIADNVTGRVTTVRYNRSWFVFNGGPYRTFPFIGTPSKVTTDVLQANGSRLVTTHDYATAVFLENGSQVYPFHTYRMQDVETVTEGGTQLSRVVRTYDVDRHGNQRCSAVDWAGTGVTCQAWNYNQPGTHTFVEAEYQDDEASWLVGNLTYRLATSRTGSLVATREVAHYYDSVTGALTSTVQEPYTAAERLTSTFKYDARGNLIRASTTDGVQTRASTIDWDSEGIFPYRVTNPLGHATRLRFDRGLGVLLTSVDPNGLVTQLRHDGFGRPRQRVGADGVVTDVTWSRVAQPDAAYFLRTAVATTGSGSITRDFDRLGRPLHEVTRGFEGAQVAVDTTWDRKGPIASRTLPYFTAASPAGQVLYLYDNLGRLLRTTRPDGSTRQVRYDGLTTSVVDELGVTAATRTRNALGQVTRATTYGAATHYVYGPFGTLRSTRDAAGNVTVVDSDDYGRTLAVAEPSAGKRRFDYDRFGQRIAVTDALGWKTTYSYDLLGRLLRRSDREGDAEFTYDGPRGLGRLARAERGGTREAYTYDTLSRLQSVEYVVAGADPSGPLTFTQSISYDATGRVDTAKLSTPEQVLALGYTWDGFGHLAGITAGATNVWSADVVNAAGQLEREVFSTNHVSNRSFDPLRGWLEAVSTSGPGGALVQSLAYAHDLRGDVVRRTDAVAGRYQRFEYGGREQLEKVWTCATGSGATCTGGETLSRQYLYDVTGNMAWDDQLGVHGYDAQRPQLMVSAGGQTYGYDANGNTTSRPGMTLDYTSFEKVKRATVFAGGFPAQPGTPVKLVNDALGRCSLPLDKSTAAGVEIAHADCSAGQYDVPWLHWSLKAVYSDVPAGVDGPFYQVVNAHSGKCLGVRGASTSRLATLEQQTCVSGPAYAAHQLWWLRPVAGTRSYLLVSKNVASGDAAANGRCVELPGGGADPKAVHQQNVCNPTNVAQRFHFDGAGFVTDFLYDAFQRRVAKVSPHSRTVSVGGWVEREVAGSVVTTRFRVAAGRRTVGTITSTGADTTWAFFHSDALGSASYTSALSTTGGAAALARTSFDPFGRAEAGGFGGAPAGFLTAPMSSAGFTGHGHDDELGLIDMNGRAYDPAIGRFLSADALVQAPFDARSLNRYSYAWNNPLRLTDPSGFCVVDGVEMQCEDFDPAYIEGAPSGSSEGETGSDETSDDYGGSGDLSSCEDIDCGGVGPDEGMSLADEGDDWLPEDGEDSREHVPTYFVVSPSATPAFRQAVEEALTYLREQGKWNEEFDAAANGLPPVEIVESFDYLDSAHFSVNKWKIEWNPFQALRTYNFDAEFSREWTGANPPAVSLAHELAHVLGAMRDTARFLADHGKGQTILGDREERRVIEGPERDLVDNLGLGGRNNHGGEPAIVDCVTCVPY